MFWASSTMTKAWPSVRPRRKAIGATSISPFSRRRRSCSAPRMSDQRLPDRGHVGVDLLGQVAGQEAEPLARPRPPGGVMISRSTSPRSSRPAPWATARKVLPVPAGPRPNTSSQSARACPGSGPGSRSWARCRLRRAGRRAGRRGAGAAPASAGARLADGHAHVGLVDLQALRRRRSASALMARLACQRARASPCSETPPPGVSTSTPEGVLDQGGVAAAGAGDRADAAASERRTNSRARLTQAPDWRFQRATRPGCCGSAASILHRNDLADQSIAAVDVDRLQIGRCGRRAGRGGGRASRTAPAGCCRPAGWLKARLLFVQQGVAGGRSRSSFDLLGHLAGHGGAGGARAARVLEREGRGVADLADQAAGSPRSRRPRSPGKPTMKSPEMAMSGRAARMLLDQPQVALRRCGRGSSPSGCGPSPPAPAGADRASAPSTSAWAAIRASSMSRGWLVV